jgi:hypothetical protein
MDEYTHGNRRPEPRLSVFPSSGMHGRKFAKNDTQLQIPNPEISTVNSQRIFFFDQLYNPEKAFGQLMETFITGPIPKRLKFPIGKNTICI